MQREDETDYIIVRTQNILCGLCGGQSPGVKGSQHYCSIVISGFWLSVGPVRGESFNYVNIIDHYYLIMLINKRKHLVIVLFSVL